jgi:hypothetical protein
MQGSWRAVKPFAGRVGAGQQAPALKLGLNHDLRLRILAEAYGPTLTANPSQVWRRHHEETQTHRNGKRRIYA